jgi:hypothetical protein
MILATENGPGVPHGRGLSLYIPLRDDNVIPRYETTDFNQKTGWLAALSKLHENQKKDGMKAPKVTEVEFGNPVLKAGVTTAQSGADMTITPSDSVIPLSGRDADNGSWLKIVIEGEYILWGRMGIAASDTGDPDGEYTTVLNSIMTDEMMDPDSQKRAAGSEEIVTPVFKDGRNELAYQVGGLAHKFSNGEKSVLVTADFLDLSDPTHFVVQGTYSDSQTNGELPVEVKVDTNFYSIESVTAVVPNESGEGSSTFTVTLRPEGVFRPSLEKRTGSGAARRTPGEEIVWKDGLSVIMDMILEGRSMRIVGMAESLGGAGAELLSRPVTVKANPNITPYLDATHQEGGQKLPGSYAVAASVPRRDNDSLILAPTGGVVEIGSGPSPNGNGVVNTLIQKVPGQEDVTTYLNWELEGLPFLSRFVWDDVQGFVLAERDYAVLISDGDSYIWKLTDAYNGSPLVLMPISEVTPDGQNTAPGFAFMPGSGALVITFIDSGKAMLYTPAGQPIMTPPLPLPPMISLDGTWGAIVNGQQWVMQYQGNQYQGWINGIPAETGVYQIQGNTMTGQTNTGMTFSNFFQMDPSGMAYTVTMPNGFTIVYQRMR